MSLEAVRPRKSLSAGSFKHSLVMDRVNMPIPISNSRESFLATLFLTSKEPFMGQQVPSEGG